ncbi:MAG: sulfatase-like hydrolase/transferase [Chloroflexota bacterium]
MSDRPNIVFLLNDHQAYYRHGWDDGSQPKRPHFDRLASEGVVFERAYTACPLCGPARRTMLTGVFPHSHGELHNNTEHPYDFDLYLDVLADSGYRNYYYGKWHAGPGTALDHQCEGFNYHGYSNPYTKPEYKAYLEREGLPEPEFLIERHFRKEWNDIVPEGEIHKNMTENWWSGQSSGLTVSPKETHEAFFLASLACDKLRELAESKSEEPFALRVDFWGPHQPYFPTREFADLYDPEDITEYGNFRDSLDNKPEIYRLELNDPLNQDGKLIFPNPLPWSEWQKVLARCYAHITMIDAAGGLILDALDEFGLADNTFVLWTADHGDAVTCHGGHFDKASYMPEEMIRIPMSIRYPGRILPGQSCDRLVSLLDLAPTLLDAAGTRFANEVDGKSLLPLCTGEGEDWRDDLMCETHGHFEEHIGRLVVTERYKYVANQGQMDELYDLENDPYELDNLIDDPACESILSDMRARLLSWQQKTGDRHSAIG